MNVSKDSTRQEPDVSISVAALIRPAKGAMVLSAVLTALGAIVTLVPFVALHNMAAIWLDGQVRTGWTGKPWVWAVIAVLSLFVGQLLYLFGLGVTHEAEAKLRHRLRGNVVQALGSLPLGRVSQVPHGAIRKMVCDDTAAIHTLVAHVPGDVTNAVVSMVVGLGYLVWVDWRLALALFGTWAVAIMIIVSTTMRGYSDITERFGHAQTALAAATVEMLEGIKEIKNFQATDATRTRFNAARQQFSAISFDWVRRSGRAISLLGSLLRPATVFVTVALLAALFVAQDWSTLSATLPFFLIAPGIPEGFTVLVGLMQHIYESQLAARTTAELLSEKPMPEGSRTQEEGPNPGQVEVCEVSFSYEPDVPVVHGVSFTAEPGTVTALVGPSGGGKSTLARLIARFYDVNDGVVRISGVDVREASFSWLLSRVAIVLQDVTLSNDSVHTNIALSKPSATRAEVEAAARAACIHDRIMRLPEGYDTVLGEVGGFLSGGERQRITLARAYLQDAPILILDEATAQADPQSERAIHEALSTLASGRTVIIIAHRLATIRDADQILVIEDGHITQRGRHEDLVDPAGTYSEMWRAQELHYMA